MLIDVLVQFSCIYKYGIKQSCVNDLNNISTFVKMKVTVLEMSQVSHTLDVVTMCYFDIVAPLIFLADLQKHFVAI